MLYVIMNLINNKMKKYTLITDNNKIIIQKAEYIEDGWYIEINNEGISLYEIPQFGGNPILIGQFSTINKAIEKAESLI